MRQDLIRDLKQLGIQTGDTLFVHSSLKGLNANITPKEIIDSLLAVIGDAGTLLLPSFSYVSVSDKNPHFNVHTTPSCVGIIPEYFRTHYPVMRSLHPTHSVCAIGKHAKEMTRTHQDDHTPVGPHSPISKLCHYDGKILMLGCGLSPSTFVHGVEETVGVSYCLKQDRVPYFMTDALGNTLVMNYIRHDFERIIQRYDRLADVLPSHVLTQGNLLNGVGHVIDYKLAVPLVTDTLKNRSLYFVDVMS